LLQLLTAAFGTKRRKTMSAPTSASGDESGNVARGTNSTLVPPVQKSGLFKKQQLTELCFTTHTRPLRRFPHGGEYVLNKVVIVCWRGNRDGCFVLRNG
jgi:hypothetical protein